MLMSGTLAIWSFSRSDNGTRMLYTDVFDWGVGSSMNYQRYKKLKEID